MQPSNENKKGLLAWFFHNHVAANILMLLFILGGIFSISQMRTESFPAIDPRVIVVSVVYPGATPYEISDSITRRVEEALIGTEGVKRISSNASEGIGITYVELKDFASADDAYNDVETAVSGLVDFPPEDAERPIVNKVRITPDVLTLAVHGDVSEHTLKYWAETIEEELRQMPGVALTSLRGIREYQISVEVSEDALREYGLSLKDISAAIRSFSDDIPAGTIEAKSGEILLRVQERRYTGEEFESIVVRSLPDGSSLLLGDVGKVVDGFEDVNLISKFNGQRAAFIDIKRSEADDTLTVANIVKNYVSSASLPTGLHISLQRDATVNLKDRISLMLRNGILGFMLVFLILLFFLDLKLAFWISAAIPISFLGGIMLINLMGYSMNMITLFALIVVLGIVVDDGIIVGESIFDAQRKSPGDPDAALRGVRDVMAPVTIGVATTMAAFGPLILSTGTLGQIVQIIPIAVIAILFVSLLEAYLILPAHLSSPGEWSKGIVADIRNKVTHKLEQFTQNRLLPAVRFAVNWRYATIASFIAITIIVGSLVQSGIVRFVFFPQVEGDHLTIDVTMPLGTPFGTTQKALLKIETAIQTVQKNLDKGRETSIFQGIAISIGETTGSGPFKDAVGNSGGSHLGQARVRFVPSDDRDYSAFELEGMIRKQIGDLPNVETMEIKSSIIGAEPDIEIELNHPQEHLLNQAAEELKTALDNINGTKEVQDSFEQGKTEYVFELSEEGIAVGLSPNDLGQQLRSAFFGLEAQRIQRGRSEVIVYVRYPKADRENASMLDHARIRLPNGQEVPLKTVATIKQQRGYSQIRTVNGRSIVSVTGDVDSNITTPNDVIKVLNESVLPKLLERYPTLKYSFEGESREQGEDMASLGNNMLIALMLIYVLLGSQLRSYTQPFVIIAAIPFGIVGAVLGHWILGHDLSFISMFGIVALSGVVVNDSVVLIDYLNKKRAEGMGAYDSAILAVERRFRPILLTTLSTSLGLMPMLMETSLQARFLMPMVVALTTGILFATFIILLLVPCLIVIIDDVEQKMKHWRG